MRHRRLLSSDVSAARALLGCREGATRAEIKMAFRRAALKVHPDVNARKGATGEFQALSSAARTLLSHPTSEKRESAAEASVPQEWTEEVSEWRQALRKVLDGPALEDTRGEFPPEFEIEERNVGHLGPVLKLVHGRKEIGFVEETRLLGNDDDDGWRGRCLSLSLFGSVIATAAKMRGETTICFRGIQNFFVLGPPVPGKTVLGLGGWSAHRITNGKTTHRLLESESPGVKNMLIHRLVDERLPNHVYHPQDVVVRTARAWFPKKEYWLPFYSESRSQGYASDGISSSVYVEILHKRKMLPSSSLDDDDSSPFPQHLRASERRGGQDDTLDENGNVGVFFEGRIGHRRRKRGAIGEYLTRRSQPKQKKTASLTLTLTRWLVENRKEHNGSSSSSSTTPEEKKKTISSPPEDDALAAVCVFASGFSVLRREGKDGV